MSSLAVKLVVRRLHGGFLVVLQGRCRLLLGGVGRGGVCMLKHGDLLTVWYGGVVLPLSLMRAIMVLVGYACAIKLKV